MKRRALALLLALLVVPVAAVPQELLEGAENAAEEPTPTDAAAPPSEAAQRVDRLIGELRSRMRQLDRREREVAAREAAVAEAEGEARRMLEEVGLLRVAFEKRVEELATVTGSQVGKLAKVYGAMPPDRSAPLLEALDLDLSTRILTKMKHKQSAQVLSRMSDDAALRISRSAARPATIPEVNPPVNPGGTQ